MSVEENVIRLNVTGRWFKLQKKNRKFKRWWKKQEKMRKQIHKTCTQYGDSLRIKMNRIKLLYDPKHELLFCEHAKVITVSSYLLQSVKRLDNDLSKVCYNNGRFYCQHF